MNIDTVLKCAIESHQNGDIKLAKLGYKKILRVMPLHFDALHLLGVIYFNEHKLADSLKFIKRALLVNSQFSEAHFNLGNTYMALGKLIEAKGSFQKAIEIKPSYIDAYNNLGTVLRSLADFQTAQKTYEIALQIAPSDRLWFNYGNVLADQRFFDKAKVAFKHALKFDPQQCSVWDALGSLYAVQGHYQDALPCYKQAITCSPEFANAHSNISYAMLKLNRLDEGLFHANKAVELDSNSISALTNFGSALAYTGSFTEAAIQLKKAKLLNPKFIKLNTAFGHLKRLQGDWQSAAKYYLNSLSLDEEIQGLEDGVYLAIIFYLLHDLINAKKYLLMSQSVQNSQLDIHAGAKAYHILLDKLLQDYSPAIEVISPKRLYVIGESHSLPYSNLTFQYNNEEWICQSLWIIGCKMWHLGNVEANQYKSAVRHHFQSLHINSFVLITIGEIDCRLNAGIIPYLKKNSNVTMEQSVSSTINGYLNYLSTINEPLGHHLIISGVPAPNIDFSLVSLGDAKLLVNLIEYLNAVLKQESIRLGFGFIDTYALTNGGDGVSNKEWHIDDYHLKPNSVQQLFSDHYLRGSSF